MFFLIYHFSTYSSCRSYKRSNVEVILFLHTMEEGIQIKEKYFDNWLIFFNFGISRWLLQHLYCL